MVSSGADFWYEHALPMVNVAEAVCDLISTYTMLPIWNGYGKGHQHKGIHVTFNVLCWISFDIPEF